MQASVKVSTMNQSPLCRDLPLGELEGVQMADVLQWIGFSFGVGLIALGVMAFFRGLSLPPNSPEHRAHGKGDNWRT
jgi:hypothetical protein